MIAAPSELSPSCRFCSSRGPTVSLLDGASFVDDGVLLTLAEAVCEVAQVSLNLESRGSLDICTEDCLVQLESCYRFRERVRLVESTRRRFARAEVKLEIIEEDENQFDEEEFLEERDGEDGGAVNKFVMPAEELIVTHLAFEHFDYVEFRGERCCGCELICCDGVELRDHVEGSHARRGEVSGQGCSNCGREFSSLVELGKHREHYSTKELLVCKLCQLSFIDKESLMLHMEESPAHRSSDDGMEPDEDEDDFVEPPPAEGLDIEIEFTDADLESETNHLKLPEDKLISAIEDFEQHRIITVVEGSERCCVCGVYFRSTEQLLEHARREHHKDNRIEGNPFCDVCLESYRTSGSLNTHKTLCRHVKKLFYCKLCQLVYIRKFQIVNHFKHTPNHTDVVDYSANEKKNFSQPKPQQSSKVSGFACCFLRCSTIFDQEPELMAHVEEQHAPRRVINLSQRTSEQFVCSVCQRNFSSHPLLLLHRNRTLKKKHICSHCGEPFLIPSKLRDHERLVHSQSTSPLHPCEVCGKAFRTPNLLKAHQLTHDERRDFACEQCPARFKFRFQLRKHLNGVHPTNFPYQCAFCEKKFAVKAKHDLHVRSHTGAKPYTCRYEACGKQFSHVTDRKRHEMGLHTGERPYRCDHCLVGFIRKRELLIHAQKHQLQGQEV